MAALLSCDIPGRNFKRKDSLVEHLEDCQRMNIAVVPPDVNSSDVEFAVAEGRIHFGLSAIKSCGGAAAEAIVAGAQEDKARSAACSTSVNGWIRRPATASRIETLIKAGAFDSLGARRSQLLAALDRAMQSGAAVLADRRSGQKSLFADRRRAARPDTGTSICPISRNGTSGSGCSWKRKRWGSTSPTTRWPSIENAGRVLLAHHQPMWPHVARPCGSRSLAACSRPSRPATFAMLDPAPRTPSTPISTSKTMTARSAASFGPRISPPTDTSSGRTPSSWLAASSTATAGTKRT